MEAIIAKSCCFLLEKPLFVDFQDIGIFTPETVTLCLSDDEIAVCRLDDTISRITVTSPIVTIPDDTPLFVYFE
ncbi:hypothetical protein D1872_326950 [compost metagenome]